MFSRWIVTNITSASVTTFLAFLAGIISWSVYCNTHSRLRHLMGVCGQRHAPAALLPPGKGHPVPIVQEAGWAPEPVWTQRIEEKSFAPPGIEPRLPGRPAELPRVLISVVLYPLCGASVRHSVTGPRCEPGTTANTEC
jgi:hypothetical protein